MWRDLNFTPTTPTLSATGVYVCKVGEGNETSDMVEPVYRSHL